MKQHFISYSYIFISYIQCFEVSFQKSVFSFFLKSCFFQNFDWSNLIFDQSKSYLKNSVSLCLVWLIEHVFRSIEHRDSSFFKTVFWLIQHFFTNFSLSLRLGKAPLKIFCRFSLKFLQGFSLTRLVRPLYPSFCFYFHDFMHKLMHFKGILRTFQIWDFCRINLLFLKLIIGFSFYIDIFMIYVG